MSNVLIGIIGVVLFIGLAVAGSVILGDDFRSANASSKAAAITSTLQQAVQAASMYELKTGRQISATSANVDGSFLVPRFLGIAPVNAYSGAPVSVVDADGSGISGAKAVMFYTNIGTDQRAREICRSIEEAAGASDPEASQSPANTGNWTAWTGSHRRVGCLINIYSSPAMYQAYAWF